MITVPHSPRQSHRLRDVGLYIAIGLGVAMVALVIAQSDISHEAFIRWGGLIVNTSVLFGYFIAGSRRFFRKLSFWALTTVLLSLHVVVFVLILTHVNQWKLIWFMVMVLEVPILLFSRNWFLKTSTRWFP